MTTTKLSAAKMKRSVTWITEVNRLNGWRRRRKRAAHLVTVFEKQSCIKLSPAKLRRMVAGMTGWPMHIVDRILWELGR